ncbi:MAG TPA: hypothetical protein VFA07_05140 [Chthonomonadaceae bacterium]|nr:hypothetical protein [Chthonomonadaceae bacterium]
MSSPDLQTDSFETSPVEELNSPPKPRLAFRVGVVGHRPNRLHNADLPTLGGVIASLLSTVQEVVQDFADENKELFLPVPPVLRAISPLAEGSDRLFAEQALALGWELCCPMPFCQEEYEKDFHPGSALETDSLDRFRSLKARATGCFQLDGNRNGGAVYGICGQVVLNQSDLLLVIWDGKERGKIGGTETTLAQAKRAGVPVIWIDADAPHTWQWISGGASSDPDGIQQVVRNLLKIPEPLAGAEIAGDKEYHPADARKDLMRYYEEKRPRRNKAVLWKVFRDIVADSKRPTIKLAVPPFENAVLPNWPQDEEIADRLRPFYAWPDKLSGIYADKYRSAFILVYLLAAFAVGFALAPVIRNFKPELFVGIAAALELAAIGRILFVVIVGRKQAWHERWLDYRLVAELVRHLRIVSSLGGQRPFPQLQAHETFYGHPSATWMEWYVRAVSRWIGLPDKTLDKDYLAKSLTDLETLLEEQRKYHQSLGKRAHIIETRLHQGVLIMLWLTVACCVFHLFPGFISLLDERFPTLLARFPVLSTLSAALHDPKHLLTFLCGFLPALGAAFIGMNNQGEFRRVARRSESMHKHLSMLLTDTQKLKDIVQTAAESHNSRVRAHAEKVAIELMQEVLDWRVMFLDRPLEVEA